MVLNIAHGHPTGVQRDNHVVELCEPTCTLGHHPRSKRAGTIPGHSHFNRAVARIDGLGVGPVTVIAALCGIHLRFGLAVAMAIAQMRIHLRFKTSVDRCLQQAFDQLACIISRSRQLADQAGDFRIFHQLLADLVDPRRVMVFLR